MPTSPTPPLSPFAAGEKVYLDLVATYGSDAEVEHLARCAGDAWQRLEEARVQLAAEGLTIHAGASVYQHPSIKTETTARAGFLSAMRLLRQPVQRSKAGRKPMGELVSTHRHTPMSKIEAKYFGPRAGKNGS